MFGRIDVFNAVVADFVLRDPCAGLIKKADGSTRFDFFFRIGLYLVRNAAKKRGSCKQGREKRIFADATKFTSAMIKEV